MMMSLTMLEELTLSDCDIVARNGILMGLESFTISGGGKKHAIRPLQIVSPERLHELTIHPYETPQLVAALASPLISTRTIRC